MAVPETKKAARQPEAPWVRTTQQVVQDLQTNISTGLSALDVQQRRDTYGYNELTKEEPTSLWRLVLEQFDDMLVKILLLAAVVSFVLAYLEEGSQEEGIRAYIEPFVILMILILNAIVGVWQESNAEKALEALKELQSETAKVLRDGKLVTDLPARELVPGDVVELAVGDKIPADMRLVHLKTATLRAEQSSLTGEPVAVMKFTDPVSDAHCELQAKECMLFAGTAVANGAGTGVVTSIAMDTEIGKIQSQITEASKEEEDTPLKQKLDEFGELLAKVIFYICVTVWLINYHHFLTLVWQPGSLLPDWSASSFNLAKCTYYFKIAVALAVAAIPEGLPAVITTCLALGTRKMAKKNAIVRKLPSVETLGCTTVICSDKTGTLTTNQMSVVRVCAVAADGKSLREFEVTGTTYNPDQGAIQGVGSLDTGLAAIAEVCAANNESAIEAKGGTFRAVGAPTEAALKVVVEKLGIPDQSLCSKLIEQRQVNPEDCPEPCCSWYNERLERLALLEFDRDRKSMSVICRQASARTRNSGNVLLVKGAAECVLERCDRVMLPDGKVMPLSAPCREAVLAAVDTMAGEALRILALAKKTDMPPELAGWNGDSHAPAGKKLLDTNCYSEVESGLVFLGLMGLQDPPRPEVPDAIEDCRKAGIRVIVITGDNKNTAEAICREIGVLDEEGSLEGLSFTGRQFDSLPDREKEQILAAKKSMVFSRAEPKHKQDIVRLLKRTGEVVAMTGDGVNDAPALKLADIGIAMGIAGTEVAKEASDMVLADDNFSTIVAAVAEGRSIYNNMKAFIRYMISSNIGEVASIFLTAILGLPEGLIPVQLLWVNLVTDGPPATALGFNPADKDIMQKPPRRPDEQLITPWVFIRYMVIGAYVGFATVGVFVVWFCCSSFLGIDLTQDGHVPVTWYQLTHWEECPSWEGFNATGYQAGNHFVQLDKPCDIFSAGKVKASTLSLSVLVAIEMLNAYNALSEDNSLFTMPPWSNPWLTVATFVSLGLHCVILYIPFLAEIFSIVPLNVNEWALVFAAAFPVIIIDEVLKFLGRHFFGVKHVVIKPRRRSQETGRPKVA